MKKKKKKLLTSAIMKQNVPISICSPAFFIHVDISSKKLILRMKGSAVAWVQKASKISRMYKMTSKMTVDAEANRDKKTVTYQNERKNITMQQKTLPKALSCSSLKS